MSRRDAASAGVLALIALFTLAQSAGLDVGSVDRPGPGFFPLVLAAALLTVSMALLAGAWRAMPRQTLEDGRPALPGTAGAAASSIADDAPAPVAQEPGTTAVDTTQGETGVAGPGTGHGASARRGVLVATLLALAVYVVVFERLGFLPATGGLLAFLFGPIARYRWPVALGAALVATLATHVVFDVWLQVRLPRGVLAP
ncbi:MAG: tripartite tricarboxylate transporter TctB family protein [Candidatus Rokuibacteriota bacterium]